MVDLYFGLVGSHNHLCTFHTQINLSVINLFYFHAWQRMTKATRQDKNGVLQSVPWSVGSLAQWHDISVAQKSRPASQDHWSMFLNIPSQADVSKCLQSVFGLATDVWQSFLKLHECFAVVLRTSLKDTTNPFFFPPALYFSVRHPSVCCSYVAMQPQEWEQMISCFCCSAPPSQLKWNLSEKGRRIDNTSLINCVISQLKWSPGGYLIF